MHIKLVQIIKNFSHTWNSHPGYCIRFLCKITDLDNSQESLQFLDFLGMSNTVDVREYNNNKSEILVFLKPFSLCYLLCIAYNLP